MTPTAPNYSMQHKFLKWVQENENVDLLCSLSQERCGMLTEKLVGGYTWERDRLLSLVARAAAANTITARDSNTTDKELTRINNQIIQLTKQNELLAQHLYCLKHRMTRWGMRGKA